jgi:Ni,Fe-hydrogenase I small subunit
VPRVAPGCSRSSPTAVSICVWHPGLSEACGDEALAILQAAADGRLPFDILCVEGALLRGPNGSGRFQILSGSGRPVIEWVRDLAARAQLRTRHRHL